MSKPYCETCGAAKKDFCCCEVDYALVKHYFKNNQNLNSAMSMLLQIENLKKQLEEAVEVIDQIWRYDSNGEPWDYMKKLCWKFLQEYRGEK